MSTPLTAVRVTTLGTGYPRPSGAQGGPATLVTIPRALTNSNDADADVHILFDCGRNTVSALSRVNLMPHNIAYLVVTHFHSDHVTDMADFLMTRWLCYKDSIPAHVIGPPGVDVLVNQCLAWLRPDISRREAHRQGSPFPAPQITVCPRAIDEWEPFLATLVNRDAPGQQIHPSVLRLSPTISLGCVAVEHGNVTEASGYVLHHAAASTTSTISISGDCTYSPSLAKACVGTDVLVHEVIDVDRVITERGEGSRYIIEYHASPQQVGRVAMEAGVAALVLTHIIPPVHTAEHAAQLVKAVKSTGYQGQVFVGRDGAAFVVSQDTSTQFYGDPSINIRQEREGWPS